MIVLELLGLWLIAATLTVIAFNGVKHAVMSAGRR